MSDAPTRSPEEIRRDIELTREELADTAAALVERADVKARAHEKIDETKAKVTHRIDEAKAKVGAAKGKASDATPSSVSSGAQSAAGTAREHPLPLAFAGAFATGLLVGWLVARRR